MHMLYVSSYTYISSYIPVHTLYAYRDVFTNGASWSFASTGTLLYIYVYIHKYVFPNRLRTL